MVSGAFAVALSWIYSRIKCPIIQVPLPEVHNKTTKINGFTFQQPFQFNWFRAVVQLYDALTQSNSSTTRKILHADMHLSSRCDDCWSSHILSAMDGLTQSYLFKERL